jgi:hypothetical protein
MRDNFEDVISSHGPREIKDVVATAGIMDFLSVRQDETLSRGDTPNNGDIVFCKETKKHLRNEYNGSKT